MKALLTSLFITFTGISLAQTSTPTLSLVVNEVIIPNGVLESTSSPFRTFRIYAEIDPNWELLSVFGLTGTPWTLTTTGSFYHDALGGPTSLDINETLISSNPTLNYDSWFTIGAESSSNNMIFVAPIDGSVFNDWEAGSDLIIDDVFGATLGIPSPGFLSQNTADENGRILIAQITANGEISGCLNLQFRLLNPDGSIVFTPQGGTVTEIFNNVCFNIPFSNLCPSDFNLSGTVDVADLLIFISDYGCSSGCIADLTSDGSTSSPDLLLFLSEFNQVCNAQQ